MLGFHKIPLYGVFILTFGGGLLTAFLVRVFLVPYTRKRIEPDLTDVEKIIGVQDDCGTPMEPKDSANVFVLPNINAYDNPEGNIRHA